MIVFVMELITKMTRIKLVISFKVMECVLKNVEKMASEFVVGTCQLLPESYDTVSEPIHILEEYAIKLASPWSSTVGPYIGPTTFFMHSRFHAAPTLIRLLV